MQFIDNIFLLQCLKKEIATAKEHNLRPLGKVIIFRDKQTNRQNLPIIYRYSKYNFVVLDSWQVRAWKVKALLYIKQGASLEAFLIFFWKQN